MLYGMPAFLAFVRFYAVPLPANRYSMRAMEKWKLPLFVSLHCTTNSLDRQREETLVSRSQLLAHRRHSLHDGHTRYALHRTRGEVGSAIGAEFPAQFEQAFAFGASSLELLPAGGTNLEVRLHARVTVVAGRPLGHFGQQRFFLKLAFVDFGQCLARAQNHIDEEAANKEDRY